MEWNDEILFESDEETAVNIQEDAEAVDDAQGAQDDDADDEPQVDSLRAASTETPVEDVAEELEQDEEPTHRVPTEAFMEAEAVTAYLKGRKLNAAIAERLAEREYATEQALQEAVDAELAYVKQVTRSGKPFKVGAQERAADAPKVSIDERDARIKAANEKWLGH